MIKVPNGGFSLALATLSFGSGCADGDNEPAWEGPWKLRVLAYNIRHGEGLDGRVDLERIARLINEAAPDVVALQEVDRGMSRTGTVDQAGVLGDMTGMTALYGEFTPITGAYRSYESGKYGMALLSRWEIVSSRNVALPLGCAQCSCDPYPCPEGRSLLMATVRSKETGRQAVLASVHFYQNDEERLAQAEAAAAELAVEKAPVVLAGDFNSERGTPVMNLLGTGWHILEKDSAPYTIPSFAPDREIDFVLVRKDALFGVARHVVLDESVASDHRPVVADLIFAAGGLP